MIEVRDGWMFGSLPDHNGVELPVIRFHRDDKPSPGPVLMRPPNPCLHTTEGGTTLGDRYKFWDFPPNFACGDFKIVQLYPLGFASHAVDTHDRFLLQIELADRVADHPPNEVRLPVPSTLNPLVALAAFLHSRNLVTSFLRRPNPDWPVALDRLPAATDDYYRRKDGTWPAPGVYGHVELPNDEHWDPGSFNYPRFFDLVRLVLEDDMPDDRLDMLQQGEDDYWEAFTQGGDKDPGPPPEAKAAWFKKGWANARRSAAWGFKSATAPGPHEHNIVGKAQ